MQNIGKDKLYCSEKVKYFYCFRPTKWLNFKVYTSVFVLSFGLWLTDIITGNPNSLNTYSAMPFSFIVVEDTQMKKFFFIDTGWFVAFRPLNVVANGKRWELEKWQMFMVSDYGVMNVLLF
jgi:hypothetical protein